MTDWVAVTPLTDEPADVSFWHQPEFKVGDRVRVRLSGECQVVGTAFCKTSGKIIWVSGHRLVEDAQVGTVRECPYIARDGFCMEDSHTVVVRFDNEVDLGEEVVVRSGHYAACELELIRD